MIEDEIRFPIHNVILYEIECPNCSFQQGKSSERQCPFCGSNLVVCEGDGIMAYKVGAPNKIRIEIENSGA